MIPTWNISPIIKGDTFNSRQITFPFDITNCVIDMQFKQNPHGRVEFKWSTIDNTFEKINATTIVMKGRVLDFNASKYLSDLQVTYQDGTRYTYFKANLQIIQDITV